MGEETRRSLLLTGGTLGIGTAVGMAGCLDDVSEFVDGERDEDETGGDDDAAGESERPLPSFHQWLYAPGETGFESYTYAYADLEAIERDEAEPFRHWDELKWITESLDGIESSDELSGAEAAISIESRQSSAEAYGIVVLGDLDLDGMRAELDDDAAQRADIDRGSYEGYDVYFNDEAAVALGGVGNRDAYLMSYVGSGPEASGRDVVEALIDARAGRSTRLREADDTAETLLRRLGDRHFVFGTTEPAGRAESLFEHDGTATIDAAGVAFQPSADAGTYRLVLITEKSVDEPEAFSDDLTVARRLTAPTVTGDGNVVSIAGDVDRSRNRNSAGPPQAMFEIDIDHDRGQAHIVHTGGDDIRADELEIVVRSPDRREYTWAELSSADVIGPGDDVLVPVTERDSGGYLRLRWLPEDVPLYETEIPELESETGTRERPSASFSAEFDFDRNTVDIGHVGGDEIPADELVLVFESDANRVIYWEELSEKRTVAAGDYATAGLYPEDRDGFIVIVWTPEGEVIDRIPIPA